MLAHDHMKSICHEQCSYSLLCNAKIGPASLQINSAKGMVCLSHLYDEYKLAIKRCILYLKRFNRMILKKREREMFQTVKI